MLVTKQRLTKRITCSKIKLQGRVDTVLGRFSEMPPCLYVYIQPGLLAVFILAGNYHWVH